MKKIKRGIAITGMMLAMALLSGCMAFGSPATEKQALKMLTEEFGYEPKLIESFEEKSEYKSSKKNRYFEFEDEQGMCFTFFSTLESQGMDGSTFYYSYENTTNYDLRILPFYGNQIRGICDKQGLGFQQRVYTQENEYIEIDPFGYSVQYMGSGILIDGYEDLEKTAKALEEILNHCKIYASQDGILNTNKPMIQLTILLSRDEKYSKVTDFCLLQKDESISYEEIFKSLQKDYVEQVKRGALPNEIPQDLLETVCPRILKGRFEGRDFQQWSAVLQDDSDPDNPQYEFTMHYREPREREDYEFRDVYNNQNLAVQNFVALLGGTCFFHEKEIGKDGAGFQGYLGEDVFFFGFSTGKKQLLIRRNEKEYVMDLTLYNPTMDEYTFTVSKEQMEEIFNIQITYQKEESIFEVHK